MPYSVTVAATHCYQGGSCHLAVKKPLNAGDPRLSGLLLSLSDQEEAQLLWFQLSYERPLLGPTLSTPSPPPPTELTLWAGQPGWVTLCRSGLASCWVVGHSGCHVSRRDPMRPDDNCSKLCCVELCDPTPKVINPMNFGCIKLY